MDDTCKSCGAAYRPYELACSYCLTSRVIANGELELIEVTNLASIRPEYVVKLKGVKTYETEQGFHAERTRKPIGATG